MAERKIIEVSWSSLLRILFFILIIAVMYTGLNVMLALFLAIVISSGLEVAVNFFESKGLPRTFGVVLIFLIAILAISIVLYTVIPLAIVDLNSVFTLPARGGGAAWWNAFITHETTKVLSGLVSNVSHYLFSGDVSPFAMFSKALGGVALTLAVLVTSFYLSLSRDGVERFIKVVFPPDYEAAALRIYERARRKIGFWFRTQILLSAIMGFLVWGILFLLGVRHAFLIGVLAGVFELVPFAGPILSGAVAVLSAFATSPTLAIYTLLLFLAIHQFESHVLVPVLTNRVVGLHPVIVIVALLIGANIAGLWGVIVAVPAAAVLQEIIEDWSSIRKGSRASAA